jgi:NAD(P) transhydrogenase subunit alpha
VVVRGVTVVREGEITWPAPPIQVSAQPQAAAKAVKRRKKRRNRRRRGANMR